MNHSTSFNQMETMAIIQKITSKNLKDQQEGIDEIKKLLSNYEPINEPIIISLLPLILELGGDKRLQLEVELLCDEIVNNI